jgi:hypothetical protein
MLHAALMAAVLAATPTAPIAAGPMKTPGPVPTYPRLIAFPNAAVKAKVNALLAAQEKYDRAARRECLQAARAQKLAGSWDEGTEVTYLSPHYLSVLVEWSSDCASPHPNDGISNPVTYDLTTGEALDWRKLFKPGFMPSADAADKAPPAGLITLYRALYRKDEDPKDADKQCQDAIADGSPFGGSMIVWLDRKQGLVMMPDFPFVIRACADEVAVTVAALAPYVRDPAALADLTATVGKD